ncbi:hypothetical protein CLU79DRAFT_293694 [Phycomyces nitens]|nr:hypothetical protein CLU79DRAFT_293694 [Phycomyces nitens]
MEKNQPSSSALSSISTLAKTLSVKRKEAADNLFAILTNSNHTSEEMHQANLALDRANASWEAFLKAHAAQKDDLKDVTLLAHPENPQIDNHTIIPDDLPKFQLIGGVVRDSSKRMFKSVHEFIVEFEKQLTLHNLTPFDLHWERLFPLTCDKYQKQWFNRNLRNHQLTWHQVRQRLESEFGNAYYIWVKRHETRNIRQKRNEPGIVYADRFLEVAFDAGVEDGKELAWDFISSLSRPVRKKTWDVLLPLDESRLPVNVSQAATFVVDVFEPDDVPLDSSEHLRASNGHPPNGHPPNGHPPNGHPPNGQPPNIPATYPLTAHSSYASHTPPAHATHSTSTSATNNPQAPPVHVPAAHATHSLGQNIPARDTPTRVNHDTPNMGDPHFHQEKKARLQNDPRQSLEPNKVHYPPQGPAQPSNQPLHRPENHSFEKETTLNQNIGTTRVPRREIPDIGKARCRIHPGGDHTTTECLLGGGKPIVENDEGTKPYVVGPAIGLCGYCKQLPTIKKHKCSEKKEFFSKRREEDRKRKRNA